MSDDPKLDLDEPGVGKLLRERREQQGLTQQDVAASLNLRVAAIEALEAERFDLLPPRTFVRGYLRAYAKLVGLAEAEVLAAFERQQPEQQSEQPRSLAAERAARGSWLKWPVLLIALLLIGYVAYRSYYRDVALEPAATRSEAQPAVAAEVPASDEPALGEPQPAAASGDEFADEPPVWSEAATAAEPEQAAEEPDFASEEAEVVGDAVAAAEAVAAEPAPPADQVAISIEVDDESWIEVEAADGERVYAGLVQGPRTLELSGQAPLRLVIGNAHHARLYLAGEPIPLAPHIRRDVARLTLSPAQ